MTGMVRRTALAFALSAPLLLGAAQPPELYTLEDFAKVRKFDAHVHANSTDPTFLRVARRNGFTLLSINVDYPDFPSVDEQYRVAQALRAADPERFKFAASFTMTGWQDPGWAAAIDARLARQVKAGAVAVKVWKNIGLELRDKTGKLVMLDDARLEPVFAAISRAGVPLIDHQGEPKNCWLPLEQMSTENDRIYFKAHPQYYMYLQPNMPSYEALMEVRDRFVRRHPKLAFVGAHMGSMEWDVDVLARFLEANPHANVDLAARLSQVQDQSSRNRAKVRAFFIRYADRLLYASDLTSEPKGDNAAFTAEAERFWKSDWLYLATGGTQRIDPLKRDIAGLALPKNVIDRIYWSNAQRVFKRVAKT